MPDSDLSLDAPGAEEVQVIPWPLLLRRRVAQRVKASSRYPWLVLVTVLLGLFSVGFTITILAVSLSTIADDVGSSKTTLTWVITGPLLAFGIVGPAFGKAGDLFGQKRMYLLGMAGSALFAIGIAASWNAASLITFRVLASACGAASGPASMALIYSVFPYGRRVQAMGYWSMVGAGAPVLGVVAGGPIVEALSWRVIFLVQAPLVLFCVLLAAAVLPETERGDRVRFDVLGTVLLGIGVTSLLFALNRGPVFGWDSPIVLGGFLVAPVALTLFALWERRAPSPLLRLDYVRRRNVAAPIATQFFTNFAYMGGFIITPFMLDEVFGYGETRIGLLSISRPLTFAIVAPLSGYAAIRLGERATGVFGAAMVAISMAMLAQVDAASTDLLVIGGLALSGLGLGSSSPSMAATIANAVEESDLGIAGAAQQMMTQIGVVAGIQLMQTLQASSEDSAGLIESYQRAYLLGAAVCVLGVAAAAFVRRSPTRVRLERHKYPDVPHYEYDALHLGDDEHGSWYWAPTDNAVRRGGEELFRTAEPSLYLVPVDKPWMVWFAPRMKQLDFHLYVDVGTVPVRTRDRITMVDLDLDVVRTPDGDVRVLDEDELVAHTELYGYPPELVDHARSVTAEVVAMLERNEEPFATVWRQWEREAAEKAPTR